MSEGTIWLVILLAGAATFALRLSFIQLAGRTEPPALMRRALRYVPAAVLAALILPAFAARDGAIDLSFDNPRLLAGLIAAVVAFVTRSVLATLATGLAMLWALTNLMG